uniref:Reverse transcriptase domain-containing protein n=1 Tax=Graphocephala atropunctata TaxID=36148 RepID=A0A1B6L0L5_9HEMI
MERGGVCIFAKENVKFQKLDTEIFTVEGECELAGAKIDLGDEQLLLIAGYRPPTKQHQIFYQCISDCLNKHWKVNAKTIVTGDFNIDLAKDTFISSQFIAIMASFALSNRIQSFTREFKGSRSLIDHVFSDIDVNLMPCSVAVSALSDHHAQIATIIDCNNSKVKSAKSRFGRHFSESAKQYFKTMLSKERWESVFMSKNLNDKYKAFDSTLKHILDVAFPKKVIKIKKPSKIKKIVLNKETIEMRQLLLDLYIKTKDLDSTHYMRQYYLRVKQRYRSQIRQLKSQQILIKIQNSENKSKTVWDTIKCNKSGPSKKSQKVKLLTEDGQIISSPASVAQKFNDFFMKVGITTSKTPVSFGITNLVVDSLFLFKTNEKEVSRIIQEMKSKRSAGADEISPVLLKEVSSYLLKPLTHLINFSLQTGEFPEALKTSIVKPIHKKGSNQICDNFRPISLISTLSKLFEKVVLKRLTDFLLNKDILSSNQFGFVKGKTTTDAMFALTSGIVKALDSGSHALGVFFDLSKAFDTVNHKMLLRKLASVGVRGLALEWFSSYLQGRHQFVEMRGVDGSGCMRSYASSRGAITCGVPQGSVLGPVLFLLYINDLTNSVEAGEVCLFADDTSLTMTNPCWQNLEVATFTESNKMKQWFDSNLLNLNPSKTQLLKFSITDRNREHVNLLLDDVELVTSDEVKFLGLVLDKNLRFCAHVDSVCRRMSAGIFLLRQLSKFAGVDVLLTAYYGVLYPHMVYSVPIWGYECERTRFLFRLQKRAVRTVHGLTGQQSCKDYFRSSKLLTFPCIYILESLTFLKKNLSLFHNNSNHSYSLRDNNNIRIPAHSKTFFKKHLLYSGIQLFNVLPHQLKLESSPTRFKKLLRAMLVEKCYYSVREFIADGQ